MLIFNYILVHVCSNYIENQRRLQQKIEKLSTEYTSAFLEKQNIVSNLSSMEQSEYSEMKRKHEAAERKCESAWQKLSYAEREMEMLIGNSYKTLQ